MSRLIVWLFLALFLILCAIGLTFAQVAPQCDHLEPVLAEEGRAGRPFVILSGWMAAELAERHKSSAPFFYILPAPVTSVLLTHDAKGNTLLGLIVLQPDGVKVCAPMKFDVQQWRDLSSDLWGRGA